MRKCLYLAASALLISGCNSLPTQQNNSGTPSTSSTQASNSVPAQPAIELKQEVMAKVTNYDDSGLADPITLSPNQKGKYFKSEYPAIMGDTRKFANAKKVLIPRYFVSFDKNSGESAQASTGLTGPTANAHARAILKGVDDDTFQRITNTAYQDFRNKMGQAGYQLVDHNEMVNNSEYQSWDATEYPDIGRKSAKFLPDGMRTYSQFKAYFHQGKLMNDFQAAVVEPSLNVNFAGFGTKTTRGSNFGQATASAKVTVGTVVHVSGSVAGTTLTGCEQRGYCYGDAVSVQTGQFPASQTAFGTIEDTTSTGVKVLQTTLNAMLMLSGGTTRGDTEYTVTANPSAYEKAALEALFEANTRFVQKLVAADKT